MSEAFYVKAHWDAEASVWFSESNIPGLVLQADTLEEFQDLIRHFGPDLLAENLGIHEATPIRFEAVRQLTHAA